MYRIVVIGTSAGGLEALKILLNEIQKPLRVPIVIVQHLSPRHESYLPSILSQYTGHHVEEVNEKRPINPGMIYVAPPNYHVLVELDKTFSLTVDQRVCYARPSIDVTFETVSDAYKNRVIGVILTGANHDGAAGLKKIKEHGGYTLIQKPESAYASEMPEAALELLSPDFTGSVKEIGITINKLITGV